MEGESVAGGLIMQTSDGNTQQISWSNFSYQPGQTRATNDKRDDKPLMLMHGY